MKRCICRVMSSPPPPYPPPPGGCVNCFHIPSLVLLSEDSVTPCNQTATIDIMEHASIDVCSIDTDVNGDPIICPLTFSIISKGKGFDSVTIDNAGVITFTTKYEIPTTEYSFINARVNCSCKGLSTIVNVKVGFKNLCKSTVCSVTGEACDPCDGTCKDASLIIEMV